MRKLSFLRKSVGLLLTATALTSLPASADTLGVTAYSSYPDKKIYVGTDTKNNKFYFNISSENDCRFIGVETQNEKINLPESVTFTTTDENGKEVKTTYDVTKVDIDDNGYADVKGSISVTAPNLDDIHLTEKITGITYKVGDDFPHYIHFKTTSVPASIDMSNTYTMENGTPDRFGIYVPNDAALPAYTAAFPNDQFMVAVEGKSKEDALKEDVEKNKGAIAKEDSSTGIYGDNISWSGENLWGTTFGLPWMDKSYIHEVTCYGAVTQQESLTIPSYACIVEPNRLAVAYYPITNLQLSYYNEEETSFPGAAGNLKDVYVPPCITSASWNGPGFSKISNFHFCAEEVPKFRFDERAEERLHIIVPEDLFWTYAKVLEDNTLQLWSEEAATPVVVPVGEPGKLADAIAEVMKDLDQVRWLVITGCPNETDLRLCRRISRLEKLDLSQVTGLKSVSGLNGIKFLQEVILPDGLETIGESAFADCKRLYSINIPDGVHTIESWAFYITPSLRTISLPTSVHIIKDYAFCTHEYYKGSNCKGLEAINLENVIEIGVQAFDATNLREVDLSCAVRIRDSAFHGSSFLTSVIFGENVELIGPEVFAGCNLTGILEIPKKVTKLDHGAFMGNKNITKIILPKDLITIHATLWGYQSTFSECSPEIVEANMLFPLECHGFESADLSETTLYVPKLTINEYLYDDHWLQFKNILALDDDLNILDINREFTINKDEGIAEKADINMKGQIYNSEQGSTAIGYGHLTVNRRSELNLGTYSHIWGNRYSDPWNELPMDGSTLIAESKVTAGKIELTFELAKGRWHFLSLPYDVNVKDIVADKEAMWVIRKYSGKDRAEMTGNTWQNMTANDVLKAGEGYILYGDKESNDGDDRNITYSFPPASNGNAFFAKDAVTKSLAAYPSEFAHNASWNLVGNTYPAYLNLKGVEFDAPISVWTGDTYQAYSPADDEYVLSPFEAFFVQRQDVDGGDVVTLNPQARAHSEQAAKELEFQKIVKNSTTRASLADAKRSLFNVHIEGEAGSDRTRFVVNESASMDYETRCDASKFMSIEESVPQIFVMNNGVRMAIDERPLANGEFTLGSRFGKKGNYTISLDTRDAEEYAVTLIDNLTGVTTDLLSTPYAFTADESTDENRFTIILSKLSGVDAISADGVKVNVEGNQLKVVAGDAVEIMVVAADGKVVASEKSADFSAALEAGIYVVKTGGKVTKVYIGK